MSAYTRPFVIGAPGASTLLERIPLDAATGGIHSERWLQEALFRHPESLPAKEIDPHIGPLMPICMEIETGAGPADILYLTPSGQVVVLPVKGRAKSSVPGGRAAFRHAIRHRPRGAESA